MRVLFKLVLLVVAHFVGASLYSINLDATVQNHAAVDVDIFSQVTNEGYPVKCYRGEGCVWSSWPALKIASGQSQSMVLYPPKDPKSQMLIAVTSSTEADFQHTDEFTVSVMAEPKKVLGTLLISARDDDQSFDIRHTGNIKYSFVNESSPEDGITIIVMD